jgi:hypothetical protein
VERLLLDLSPGLGDRRLARDLGGDAALDEAEAVHVLELGLRPELNRAGGPDRDVGVASEAALLHVHVGDSELAQRRAEQGQPLTGLRTGADVGLGDDLHQRRAAAVVVDERRAGAVDPTRLADVAELRRVPST